ncbi:MAG TPA: hypothetical protein PKJ33_04120 [Alphaproteobacteria bacterium]|nr:hypothetical protein [Alphaproteobacteria bacterium]
MEPITEIANWSEKNTTDNNVIFSLNIVNFDDNSLRFSTNWFQKQLRIIKSATFCGFTVLVCYPVLLEKYSKAPGRDKLKYLYFIYDEKKGIFAKMYSERPDFSENSKKLLLEKINRKETVIFNSLSGGSFIRQTNTPMKPSSYCAYEDSSKLSKKEKNYTDEIHNIMNKCMQIQVNSGR